MTGAGRKGLLALVLLAHLQGPGDASAQSGVSQSGDDNPPVQRAAPVRQLRLMLLDLADLRAPDPPSGAKAPAGNYRHTFGSQRRSQDEEALPPAIDLERLEIDIVVLHGVTDARMARRVFPARDWRLLFARGSLDDLQAAAKPASAVALWLQPGVRFAGADLSLAPGEGAAVRIVSGLGPLWVLSAAESCDGSRLDTHGLCDRIGNWLSSKIEAGEMAVTGGRLKSDWPAGGSTAAPASEPRRPAPAGTKPMALRRQTHRIELTSADAGGGCGSAGRHAAVLHLRLPAHGPALSAAGYLLPIERPRAMSPQRPACALILDLGLAKVP